MIHPQCSLVTLRWLRLCFPILAIAVTAGCTGTAPAETEAPPPPVHATTIEPEVVTPTSVATAEILATRQSNMRSETAGRVVGVFVEAGDRVEGGQVLLRLDVGRPASAAQAARAAVAQSEARLNQAERELARTRKLVQTGGLPEQRLDDAQDAVRLASAARDAARAEARLARRGLTEAVIRAPFGGTVVERTVEIGEYLAPGSPLLTLADTSLLKARALRLPFRSMRGPARSSTARWCVLARSSIHVRDVFPSRSRSTTRKTGFARAWWPSSPCRPASQKQ